MIINHRCFLAPCDKPKHTGPAHRRGTCEQCTGAVPARTSTLTTQICVVKHFRGRCTCCYHRNISRIHSVCMHTKCEHSVPADWASCDYSYCRHHPAAPHCTQFALYPSASVAACGSTPQACSLLLTNCPATAGGRLSAVQSLVCGVVLRRQSFERRLAVFSSSLQAAISIIDY